VVGVDSDPLAKAVLVATADACQYSTNAHVPEGAITRKFPTHQRGEAKKR